MTYFASSYYNVMRNCHQVALGRADMRSKPERLVWTWAQIDPGVEMPDDCLLQLDEHECKQLFQAMLDKAWSMGLRPEHYQDDNKELNAVRGHLADMRCLVFKELPVKS